MILNITYNSSPPHPHCLKRTDSEKYDLFCWSWGVGGEGQELEMLSEGYCIGGWQALGWGQETRQMWLPQKGSVEKEIPKNYFWNGARILGVYTPLWNLHKLHTIYGWSPHWLCVCWMQWKEVMSKNRPTQAQCQGETVQWLCANSTGKWQGGQRKDRTIVWAEEELQRRGPHRGRWQKEWKLRLQHEAGIRRPEIWSLLSH